jgi:hypothetical protein
LVGVRLGVKGSGAETVNFDVKAKLEEKERKSQFVAVGFNLVVATKPSVVKFEVEGTATLTGKDVEISKMLDVDPETKVPYVFQRVYQYAFTAMYLLSTLLNAPPPPQNLLFPQKEGVPVEDISVDVEAAPKETVSVQAAPPSEESSEEKSEVSVSNQ